MKYDKSIRSPLLIAVLLILAAAAMQTKADELPKIKVAVSIPPLAYFAKQVGGEYVETQTILEPGSSPATYEPGPKQMIELQNSNVIFVTGVPFEMSLVRNFLGMFSGIGIVNLADGIELRELDGHHGHEHKGNLDPHIWLDPRLAKIQSETICNTLIRFQPSRQEYFRDNLKRLQNSLDSLHNTLIEMFQNYAGRKFYVFHPSFGYFAETYGLVQVAVESEGKEPSARQLASLMKQAKEDNIGTFFVQPQFKAGEVKTMADQLGAKIETIDPLAEDYIANLMLISSKIVGSFESTGTGD